MGIFLVLTPPGTPEGYPHHPVKMYNINICWSCVFHPHSVACTGRMMYSFLSLFHDRPQT